MAATFTATQMIQMFKILKVRESDLSYEATIKLFISLGANPPKSPYEAYKLPQEKFWQYLQEDQANKTILDNKRIFSVQQLWEHYLMESTRPPSDLD